ncbi:hypothetical protein ACFFUS_10495 [Vibrio gallaecicus]|uniref:hypothetical protein n=1 Tax=Vibrio gallaecicus TaxID=552386 RepID=UPI0010C9CE05|nr:hypothetical protein [Vibrio gallaecicus]MDN3616771.1 hypothetical protein [Vibrio gallaecicus]
MIIHSEITDEEISEIAWLSVLKIIFSSIDNHATELMRNDLNISAPPSLMTSLFHHEMLTQSNLADLTNMSVSGLKKQSKKRIIASQIKTKKPDFFQC